MDNSEPQGTLTALEDNDPRPTSQDLKKLIDDWIIPQMIRAFIEERSRTGELPLRS